MFTIKNVTRVNFPPGTSSQDSIRLYEGRNPIYGPAENTTSLDMQVSFDMDDGTHCSLDTGVVFIMNAAGKTVDTYRLKGSDWF